MYSDVPVGATTAQQERLVAENKAEVAKYKKYLGVTKALKLKMFKAVELIYLKKIEDPLLHFDEMMPMEMLKILQEWCGDLGYVDTTALKKEYDSQWDHGDQQIVAYFV